MDGPYVEIRLVDHAGNVIKREGEPLEDQWEFETLADAVAAFEEATELFEEAWGPEGEEGDDGGIDDE